ncbi:MAG: hypothetical protein FJ083_13290 [Cyanobacteria bacterium K_Offshore_surface_m2_239]|nr:hypothetical protein [Cyanobacteria bacterium K_Offshore_surface_m2_239]
MEWRPANASCPVRAGAHGPGTPASTMGLHHRLDLSMGEKSLVAGQLFASARRCPNPWPWHPHRPPAA